MDGGFFGGLGSSLSSSMASSSSSSGGGGLGTLGFCSAILNRVKRRYKKYDVLEEKVGELELSQLRDLP